MKVSGHRHAQPDLFKEKEPRYQLKRGLGGLQGRSRGFWRREKSLVPAGIHKPNIPARSLVTTQTTISRLSRRDGC
jgi:hypothetical protein